MLVDATDLCDSDLLWISRAIGWRSYTTPDAANRIFECKLRYEPTEVLFEDAESWRKTMGVLHPVSGSIQSIQQYTDRLRVTWMDAWVLIDDGYDSIDVRDSVDQFWNNYDNARLLLIIFSCHASS